MGGRASSSADGGRPQDQDSEQDQDQDQGSGQDGDQHMQIQEPGNIQQEDFRLGRQEI
jgi:hypothetical protein